MYAVLHELLMDKRGEQMFTCFSPYHLFWIAATLAVAGFLRKRRDIAERILNLAVGLYALDFFLMPLAYGYIDIEKLPFHVCTAMCLMCLFSRRPRLATYRQSFALLGFLSNLVYLCYPAGVMWHQVAPLSYRVIQTLLFHALMTVYGFIALWNDPPRPGKRELAVLTAMTAWALLGNWMYNGTSEGYDHFFNWFFVIRDPFYLLPESVAPWIMPPLNIAIFFAAEHVVCAILRRCKHETKHSGG